MRVRCPGEAREGQRSGLGFPAVLIFSFFFFFSLRFCVFIFFWFHLPSASLFLRNKCNYSFEQQQPSIYSRFIDHYQSDIFVCFI